MSDFQTDADIQFSFLKNASPGLTGGSRAPAPPQPARSAPDETAPAADPALTRLSFAVGYLFLCSKQLVTGTLEPTAPPATGKRFTLH